MYSSSSISTGIRPKKIDEVVFQTEVVAVLKSVLEGADLPNLLFYGPPGTGKTSAAIALCRQLFKTQELLRDRVLEMNASDERGIQIIKDFAQRAVPPSSVGGSCSSLKVIILDEADAMTHAAQAAMRRTMEKYSKTTRMKFICSEENLKLDDEALLTLIELCEGDLRKSITYLQSVASCNQNISSEFIRRMTGTIDDNEVLNLLTVCRSLDGNQLVLAVDAMRRAGHSGGQLISQLYSIMLEHEELADIQKAMLFEKLAVNIVQYLNVCYINNRKLAVVYLNSASKFNFPIIHYIQICESRLLDGADEYLQLLDLVFCVQNQFKLCN
uniref:AAA domain-containing protein n=1 Tax=Heterorhabditis bacteriophora TaxID=37862 RepID=A0A1I7X4K9_HETBA